MTPAALPEPPTTTPAGNLFGITDIWRTGVFTELLGNVIYRAFGQRKGARSVRALELTEPLPWRYAAQMGAGHTSS